MLSRLRRISSCGSVRAISAVASGGVYQYKDGRTAPDTIHVLLEYPTEFTVTFEATLVPGITGAALEFCGTEGRLWISRARFEFHPVRRGPGAAPEPTIVQATGNMDQDHMSNFLECVKSRQEPNAPIELGNYTNIVLCLGCESLRTGRRLQWKHAERTAV